MIAIAHQLAILASVLALTALLMLPGCAEVKDIPLKVMQNASQHSDGGG